MKKLIFVSVIALLAVGTLSAQNRGRGWAAPPADFTAITVEGTLQLQSGFIVLSTGTAYYRIMGLRRYVGFIDGLREGARISVEGFASGNFLRPTKFTIAGREYDLSVNTQERCPFERQMHRQPHRGNAPHHRNVPRGRGWM